MGEHYTLHLQIPLAGDHENHEMCWGKREQGRTPIITILFYHYKHLVMKQMIVEENKNVQNQSSKISESFVDNLSWKCKISLIRIYICCLTCIIR